MKPEGGERMAGWVLSTGVELVVRCEAPNKVQLLLPALGYADFTPHFHPSWHTHTYLPKVSSYLKPYTNHQNIEVRQPQTPFHRHAYLHALAPQYTNLHHSHACIHALAPISYTCFIILATSNHILTTKIASNTPPSPRVSPCFGTSIH